MLRSVTGDVRSTLVGWVLTTVWIWIGGPMLVAVVLGILNDVQPFWVFVGVMVAGAGGAGLRMLLAAPLAGLMPSIHIADAEVKETEVFRDEQRLRVLYQVEVYLSISTRSKAGSVSDARLVCGAHSFMAAFLVESTDQRGNRYPTLSTGSLYPESRHRPNFLQLPAMLGPWQTQSGWLVFSDFTMPSMEEVQKEGLWLEIATDGHQRRLKVHYRVVR